MTREHIEFVLSEYSTDALAGKLLELFDEEAASYQYTINKLNKALSENKGEWIPITEGMELPEHDVICCDNEGNLALGYLYFDEEENQIACDRDPYVMFGVAAYMELPEPYKKGE